MKRIELRKNNNIWTRDFTILTIGSIVSFMGTSVVYFVMGYLVLDQSNSVLNYSLYLVTHNLVGLLVPLLAGTYLDKFSRKKTIYIVDYISTAVYFAFWLSCQTGSFRYWMAFIFAVIVSITDSVYKVAFKSLFPMMVKKAQLPKAYAVLSAMETLSMVIIPLAVFFYKKFGIEPVFKICWILFGIAATVELFIKAEEKYISKTKSASIVDSWNSFCEGISYVKTEKALLVAIVFELMIAIAIGTQETVLLPYCNNTFNNGYLWYCLIAGALTTGNFWGSGLLYFLKIPRKLWYGAFVTGAIFVSLASAVLLNVPIWLMVILELATGICQLTSSNIINSSTQGFLEDNRKARYNGVAQTFCSLGLLLSQFMSGVCSEVMSLQMSNIIICGTTVIIQIIVYCFLGKQEFKDFLNK